MIIIIIILPASNWSALTVMALAATVIGRSIFLWDFLCFITVLLQTEEPRGFVLHAEAAYFLAGNLTRNKIVEFLFLIK